MSTPPGRDGYRLMWDSASSVRLTAQHHLWKQTCGFNLHPQIFSSLSADQILNISDIGTGTGTLSTPLTAAPNCSIHQLDILGELPEDLKGVYHVVHVRLIQGGLKDDPVPALKNMIAMLKPGGYFQWQEINLSTLLVATAKPDLDESRMQELVSSLPTALNTGKWTTHLAETCTQNGLLGSKTHTYHVPPGIIIPFMETQLLAYAEISRVAMDNSSASSEGARFRALLEGAHGELTKGVCLDHGLEVIVARKSF